MSCMVCGQDGGIQVPRGEIHFECMTGEERELAHAVAAYTMEQIALEQIRERVSEASRADIVNPPEDSYYVQDSRQYVGNSVLWWRKDRAGYTTNLAEAHVFTEAEADACRRDRATDIPWPKAAIDAIADLHVDMQRLREAKGAE